MFDFVRLPWWRRWFGTQAERAAANFLRTLGYVILARNYLSRGGELDLVALDQATIVFVEVRSTSRGEATRVLESVDAEKQRRLTRAALAFLQHKRLLGRACRFDVIAVTWPLGARSPRLEHHVSAFPPTDEFQMHT